MASFCENTVNGAKLFELMSSKTEENTNSKTLIHVSKSNVIDKQAVPKLKRKLSSDQLDSVGNDPNVCANKQKIEDGNSISGQHSEGAVCVDTDNSGVTFMDLSWLINFKIGPLLKEDEIQHYRNYNGREDEGVTSPGMCKL
jgi:hypothetical protein